MHVTLVHALDFESCLEHNLFSDFASRYSVSLSPPAARERERVQADIPSLSLPLLQGRERECKDSFSFSFLCQKLFCRAMKI